VALGLPLLDAMYPHGRARAAEPPPRFLVIYTPGGTILDRWRPTGTETSFRLGPLLSPLEPYKSSLLILDGLELAVTRLSPGHPHSKGIGGLLTGMPLRQGTFNTNGGNAGFADGPSVDQVLGKTLGQGRRFNTLEFGVRWSTGIAGGGKSHPANALIYQAANRPVPPATDPQAIWTRLFGGLDADAARLAAERARARSILDLVGGQYRTLAASLGRDDRAKLEEYASTLREIETSLDARGAETKTCQAPLLDKTVAAGHRSDQNIPATSRVMIDMLVTSFACDLTRVATLQYTDSEAKHTFPWLNLRQNHHYYQHDGGFHPEAITQINLWYAGQVAYLLKRLSEVREGDRSLLDNTLILWGTEIQHPNTHRQDNMPFVLAGKAAGRLRTGRWLRLPRSPHNNLLVSCLNLLGVEARSFGHRDFVNGPLPGLT
jgi:hypothetical protein